MHKRREAIARDPETIAARRPRIWNHIFPMNHHYQQKLAQRREPTRIFKNCWEDLGYRLYRREYRPNKFQRLRAANRQNSEKVGQQAIDGGVLLHLHDSEVGVVLTERNTYDFRYHAHLLVAGSQGPRHIPDDLSTTVEK
jgi:hypothetical protein